MFNFHPSDSLESYTHNNNNNNSQSFTQPDSNPDDTSPLQNTFWHNLVDLTDTPSSTHTAGFELTPLNDTNNQTTYGTVLPMQQHQQNQHSPTGLPIVLVPTNPKISYDRTLRLLGLVDSDSAPPSRPDTSTTSATTGTRTPLRRGPGGRLGPAEKKAAIQRELLEVQGRYMVLCAQLAAAS